MAAYFKTESFPAQERITFRVLETRLIKVVNARIQNGEFTERGLAKFVGISQPQIHNVLKGVRKLHVELADRLLRVFELTVVDLLDEYELEQYNAAHQVPPVHPGASPSRLGSSAALPRKGPAQEWHFPRRNLQAPR
jgi:antitoxin component HigA of HigAB toxin-antitoxin module